MSRITSWPLPLKRFLRALPFADWALVNPGWRWRLARYNANASGHRLKVGFGPIVSGEYTLGNRKWEIDPIVDFLNERSRHYVADVFFRHGDWSRFAVVVLVKFMPPARKLEALKASGTRLVYNLSDGIIGPGQDRRICDFIRNVDAVIVENPLSRDEFAPVHPRVRFCLTPLINRFFKTSYAAKGVVRLFWEGYAPNVAFMEDFNREVVQELARDESHPIEMVYHTNLPSRRDGPIRYLRWGMGQWESVRLSADIAVVIKPPDDFAQQRKPPAKVLTYMASGLPTVCTPSAADKEILEHGTTGFFAYSKEEWLHYLRLLISDQVLRARMGRAARKTALELAAIERVGPQYEALFDEVLDG